MATWGVGNFENDTAIDYVRSEAKATVLSITKIYENEESLEPDEYESDLLFCKIELLIWLLEKGKLVLAEVVASEVLDCVNLVVNWKNIYLRIWDGYIDELDPTDEYRTNRRQVIMDSFNRLLMFAK